MANADPAMESMRSLFWATHVLLCLRDWASLRVGDSLSPWERVGVRVGLVARQAMGGMYHISRGGAKAAALPQSFRVEATIRRYCCQLLYLQYNDGVRVRARAPRLHSLIGDLKGSVF